MRCGQASSSMADRNLSSRKRKVDTTLQRVDIVCDEFESEWLALDKDPAKKRPSLLSYISSAQERDQSRLFVELLRIDLEYRREIGEQPSSKEYHREFPTSLPRSIERFRTVARSDGFILVSLLMLRRRTSRTRERSIQEFQRKRPCRLERSLVTTSCWMRSLVAAWAWFTKPNSCRQTELSR